MVGGENFNAAHLSVWLTRSSCSKFDGPLFHLSMTRVSLSLHLVSAGREECVPFFLMIENYTQTIVKNVSEGSEENCTHNKRRQREREDGKIDGEFCTATQKYVLSSLLLIQLKSSEAASLVPSPPSLPPLFTSQTNLLGWESQWRCRWLSLWWRE